MLLDGRLVMCLFLWIPESRSRDWYISVDSGNDSQTCGTESEPCASLEVAVENSQSGDRIYLIPSKLDNHSFNYCARSPLTHDLIISGALSSTGSQLCCSGSDLFGEGILFVITNASISFTNIIFTKGDIILYNGELNVWDSVFENSGIFLMQLNVFMENFVPTQKVRPLNFDHFQAVGNDSAHAMQTKNSLCSDVALKLIKVKREYQLFDLHKATPLDVSSRQGIQVRCRSVNITIVDSLQGDKEINTASDGSLTFVMRNSTFKGQIGGNNLQGGIHINATCDIDIVIDNTDFSGLKFYDLISAQFATRMKLTAAFTLTAKRQCGALSNEPERKPRMSVANSTFTKNLGAIAMEIANCAGSSRFWINISGSTFEDNEVVYDGAALYLARGDNSNLTLTKCTFVRNKAGVVPLNLSPKLTKQPILSRGQKVTVSNFQNVTDTTVKIYTSVTTILEGGQVYTTNRSVTTKSGGSGGALSIQHFDYVFIGNCTFVENSATAYGGTIYLRTAGNLEVKNSTMSSTRNDASSMLDGGIIASYGPKLVLTRVQLTVQTLSMSVPALSHGSDANTESLFISNISVQCPPNALLRASNITLEIFNKIRFNKSDLALSDVKYTCVPCSENTYSLFAGHFEHRTPSLVSLALLDHKSLNVHNAMVYSNPSLVLTDVKCFPCPFGGHCKGGIRATWNMWGMRVADQIIFYRCPTGYCCDKAVCSSHDYCKKYRTGTLCGRCQQGFSEALFSTTCTVNSKCKDYWFLPLCFCLSFIYALFLLFQTNIKNIIFGATTVKNHGLFQMLMTKCTADEQPKRQQEQTTDAMPRIPPVDDATSVSSQDAEAMGSSRHIEGGIFLTILFYYFQDAALVIAASSLEEPEAPTITTIKTILAGLFRFQLDVLHMAKHICPIPNMTPIFKVLLKLLFVPSVFLVLIAINVLAYYKVRQINCHDKWKSLAAKASVAFMLAILFSHQKLSLSTFTLLYCVPVGKDRVLYLDGTVAYMQTWQVALIMYTTLCVVPFNLYIAIAPSYLLSNTLPTAAFFVGCFLPLPVLFYLFTITYLLKRKKSTSQETNSKDAPNFVYLLLQGPYKETRIKIGSRNVKICWSGVLLVRRIILLLLHTYCDEAVMRQTLMLTVSMLAMLLHLTVWPCKDRRANIAGIVSNVALVTVCIVNLMRAMFEVAKFIPHGEVLYFMNILDFGQSLLLFWIPLMGMIIILGILLSRTAGRVILHCSSRQSSDVTTVSERTKDLKEVNSSAVHTKTTAPQSLTCLEKENNAKNITN